MLDACHLINGACWKRDGDGFMDGWMNGWLEMLGVHQTSAVFVNVRHFTSTYRPLEAPLTAALSCGPPTPHTHAHTSCLQ